MGQYYRPVMQKNGKITVFNRYVGKNYTMAKLMEHSWIFNPLLMAICEKLHNSPARLLWCGDYADEVNKSDKSSAKNGVKLERVWGSEDKEIKGVSVNEVEFNLGGKYFVNHDTKEYLNFSDYIFNNTKEGWCIHPVSLLTAMGNGRGGGDYRGKNDDKVGIWAWCTVEITDSIPDGYTEFKVDFEENF